MGTLIPTSPVATPQIAYDLKRAIEVVFTSWERFRERSRTTRAVSVADNLHDRYILQLVDTTGDKYDSRTLAHLEIRNEEIWILTDNSEEGIVNELVTAGIPKSQIVLAYYPPALREMGDFAVS